MATKKETKEQMYENLIKAMGEGEFAMTKFIWGIYERVDRLADQIPMDLEKFQSTMDKFIREYKDPKDGRDGKDGKDGKEGPKGRDGMTIIGPRGPAGGQGRDGKPGKPGKDGKKGSMPKHEWNGSKIRFETPEGWGDWVDLRGPVGPAGMAYGPSDSFGGTTGALERVMGTTLLGSSFERQGVSEIIFGDNLVVSRTGNGVRVDATASGGNPDLTYLRLDTTNDPLTGNLTVYKSNPEITVTDSSSNNSVSLFTDSGVAGFNFNLFGGESLGYVSFDGLGISFSADSINLFTFSGSSINYTAGVIGNQPDYQLIGSSASGATNAKGSDIVVTTGASTGNAQAKFIVQVSGGGASGTSITSASTVATFAYNSLTLDDPYDFIFGTTTGTKLGTDTGQKIAFHGSTPVIQRAGAAQAAVATTAATNTTPFGYTTAAQADAIVTLVNEIRAALVQKGIIKGSA